MSKSCHVFSTYLLVSNSSKLCHAFCHAHWALHINVHCESFSAINFLTGDKVNHYPDGCDGSMPMQRLAHLSLLNLQVSLIYLYCLIPCSTLFSMKYLIDTRIQNFLLSQEQFDMLLLGSVASTVCEDNDVGRKWSQACKTTENNNRFTCTKVTMCAGTLFHSCIGFASTECM